LLDAPQWPSESSQGNHLLFFRFVQDVAHIDEGYMPRAVINVPGLILVGRFSTDPHWPVLGDLWGHNYKMSMPWDGFSRTVRHLVAIADVEKVRRAQRQNSAGATAAQ
jgi:hypothetical protein